MSWPTVEPAAFQLLKHTPTLISQRSTGKEVPGDLSGGNNQPGCSTWGHLVCMRAAEASAWADRAAQHV